MPVAWPACVALAVPKDTGVIDFQGTEDVADVGLHGGIRLAPGDQLECRLHRPSAQSDEGQI